MNFYAVYQRFDTGFGGHADMQRVLLIWAADEQGALTVAKTWESEPADYGEGYSYEVQQVSLTEGAEPQQVFYQDKR